MVREIIRSRCLSARRPVGGARTVSSRNEEKKTFLVPSESGWQRESSSKDEVWVVLGAKLGCGKLWRGSSLEAGVYPPEGP